MADYISSNTGPEIDDAVATVKGAGNGIAVKTGTGAGVRRSIAGTLNQVDVTNGDGIAGNPTVSLAVAVTTSLSKADTAVQPASLAAVATSGSYPDLINTPTLGTAAALNVGTTTGTVAAGDDSRFSTNLTYTPALRVIGSSTGTGATLPLFSATDAGLVSGSGGGTTNFLRADGTWAPAGGGSAGGSSGQIQWNDAGAFAGIGGSTVGATGDITLALNGALSTPPLKLTGSWLTTGGDATTTKPQLLIEPAGTASTAWSNNGTGLGVNATSGFTGNLLDLQINGARRVSVTNAGIGGDQYGQLVLHGAAATQARLGCVGVNVFGMLFSAAGEYVRFDVNGGAAFHGGWPIGFANGGLTSTGVMDVKLYRDGAANTLAQRNGANPQTFRLYNTWTNSTNYQRTSITDDNTGLVIDQQYAGTGAVRTNLLDVKNNGTSAFSIDKDAIVKGKYFINENLAGSDYFYGANVYARVSVGLAANTPLGWTASTISPNAVRDIGLARDQAAVLKITDGTSGTGYIKQVPVAVSALPAAATVGAGTRGFVSNSSVSASGNFGAIVSAAVPPATEYVVPVFSDGTNWLIG